MSRSNGLFSAAQTQSQALIMGAICAVAVGLIAATAGAALGLYPWLELYAGFGGQPIDNAGMIAQIAITALFVLLALYLPANRRIMQLEKSHRQFNVSMDDVSRAYMTSHEHDRSGAFQLQGEFDSVRERITHLREHPDLGGLEPQVLELAAQMSHTSRDIADVYSHENVERARNFLRQRQEEIETFHENVAMAKRTTEELQQWLQQVETEEHIVDKQVAALRKDLKELLPQIGLDLDPTRTTPAPTVVPMTHKSQLSTGRPVVPQKPDR
ncbi:MAG: DNA repair protein [Pseudomonadota bacterium]|nr:DNA repair protein [Pseudomonadota bacterium]